MAYGDLRAVMSRYGDMILCLRCATYIESREAERKDTNFFFWVRDLVLGEVSQQDIEQFVLRVTRGKVWDSLSEDENDRILLLLEGQYPDQEILDENFCTKCLFSLQTLCEEYP